MAHAALPSTTPAPADIPCMLAGQSRKVRVAGLKPVTVMLRPGQLEDDGSLTIQWSYLKGGTYDIEAAYDHRMISREDAETRLSADLAERGMTVTAFLDEQRTTALAAALWIARYGYAQAITSPNPAARLDDMCDAVAELWDDITPTLPTEFAGVDLEFAKTMQAAVADRLWAFTAVEYARIEAGDGYGYLFDLLADGLKGGADPQTIRTAALDAPRRIRELAELADCA
ncbi:hypothetical protein [Streptomyces torulosus]|uniref:hypothetical protein n=1 Tax=Streptomyces torulosus TaxID=68276 RepID=UPI000A479EB2|nr:hypothetical protein [Streptomyces torulosus]